MKKLLLVPVMALMTLFANAQTVRTYTDEISVTTNFFPIPKHTAEVTVEFLDNNKCNLSVKNYRLGTGDFAECVGNIVVTDVPLIDEGGYKSFSAEQTITITAGDESIAPAEEWTGPGLGELPLVLSGKVNDDKLYCKVDINRPMMRQTINVVFGTDDFDAAAPTSKVYTDDLVVSINGASTPAQKADINVDFLENDKMNLSLKNFALGSGADVIYVGNIALNDIQLVDNDGYKTFEVDQIITITPGDDSVSDSWIGPMLEEVPVKMTGKINDDKLYCVIDIDMTEKLGQVIKVTFGSDITTSVNGVKADVVGKVNVYSLSGVLLRSNVESANALNGLSKGIYIVDGKKILKK